MAKRYMLIASRDPFSSNDARRFYDLAASIAGNGGEVTLFLIQNGVLPARTGPESYCLEALSEAGVRVVADEFSLRERGIAPARLAKGVQPAPLDEIVDALAADARTIWN